jgi:hypothetical protein
MPGSASGYAKHFWVSSRVIGICFEVGDSDLPLGCSIHLFRYDTRGSVVRQGEFPDGSAIPADRPNTDILLAGWPAGA